jgi:hypothetical protein
MMSRTRIELVRVLEELSGCYPHWRFGQLVANMAGIADVNVWDIEDEQLLAAASDHLEGRVQAKGGNESAPLATGNEQGGILRVSRGEMVAHFWVEVQRLLVDQYHITECQAKQEIADYRARLASHGVDEVIYNAGVESAAAAIASGGPFEPERAIP